MHKRYLLILMTVLAFSLLPVARLKKPVLQITRTQQQKKRKKTKVKKKKRKRRKRRKQQMRRKLRPMGGSYDR